MFRIGRKRQSIYSRRFCAAEACEAFANRDKDFRKKSIQWLSRLASENATWIMTSHDEDLIKQFCTRAVWLEDGNVRPDGAVEDVIGQYTGREQNRS